MTASEIDAAVAAVQTHQQGLGLAWTVRPGTVVEAPSASTLRVLLDGDNMPVTGVVGLGGVHVAGARVMILATPEGGLYAVGMFGGNTSRQQTNAELAVATGNLTLTGTPTLVPGCAITVTVKGDARYKALAVVDFDETVTGAAIGVGQLYIDGVVEPVGSQAVYEMIAATDRATVAQQWAGTVTGGTHLFELYAWRVGTLTGTQRANILHTTLAVDTYE